MRDDAAHALRVDDDLPSLAEVRRAHLESVSARRGRRFERAATAPVALREQPATEAGPAVRPLRDQTLAEPDPTVGRPISAPGRAYGSHRRGDVAVAAGYQPGRRTIDIRGQVQQPRRRSPTTAAIVARPDRTALWAFLLALFLVLMAVATANASV